MPRLLSLVFLSLLCQPVMARPVDFVLPDLQGDPLRLSDYRGKWVVVNFWASWCPPCVEELPELAAYQAAHAAEVQVIGINFEETDAAHTRAFLARLPPTGFPHLKYDSSGDGVPAEFFVDRAGRMLALEGLPSTFFVDPDGEMHGRHLGPVTRETLQRMLDAYRR